MEILQHPHLQILKRTFEQESFEIRLVGGCVRDLLRGEEPKDIDLCTDATPHEMQMLAEKHGLRLEPTGLQHGTVTFIIESTPYEVTTLRVDVETDGRHAEVQFVREFEQDAARRDLTINAMSMDFDGFVHDYFQGMEDLQANRVRFVGNARERIREDYLRILRYFRFAARFGSQMDHATLEIISEEAAGLTQISVERIWAEMSKLVMYPSAYQTMCKMFAYDILETLRLPTIDYRFKDSTSKEAAIASFFVGRPDKAIEFADSWKMSTAERDRIVYVAEAAGKPWTTADIEDQLVEGVNREWIRDAVNLRYGRGAELTSLFETHAAEWNIPTFPVRGQTLLDIGMKPGPRISWILKDLRKRWIASRFKLTADDLLQGISVNS